jgi:transposase
MEVDERTALIYKCIFGIPAPWEITDMEAIEDRKRMVIQIEYPTGENYSCPVCGSQATLQEYKLRRFRHVDTCSYRSILEIHTPVVLCPEHGLQELTLRFCLKIAHYKELNETQFTS